MSALLTAASVLMCPHGGMVTASPASTNAVAGSPLLGGSDTCVIAGCAFNIAGAPHPCVSVQWVVATTRVQRGGIPALNTSSVGLCLAADQTPQGTVMINSTQPSVVGL